MTPPRPATVPRHRPARRFAAALGVAAVVVPLVSWTGTPATAAPLGAPAVGPAVSRVLGEPTDDNCTQGTFKLIEAYPTALKQLGAQQANTIATGAGVTVAVVDSGVDVRNVHLRDGAVQAGQDLTPGGGGGNGQTDTVGHGTAVAGEIAARPYPGSGVVGLAPDATILPIRVYNTKDADTPTEDGSLPYPPSVEGISAGIINAADSGAKVINVSMSTPVDNPGLSGAVRYAAAKGALVVASAGNRNTSTDKSDTARYPGAYPDALAVAAIDAQGQVTDDSIHGPYIDVAAPGVDILTAYRDAGDCQLAVEDASTSYATAYVSATVALIAQAHPDETPAQWRYRLEATALRVRPDTRDDDAGWGIIQPYEALTYVFDGTAVGPPDPVRSATSTPSPVEQRIPVVAAPVVDHTDRDRTLWLTFGGVVGVLLLALVALLRRDRGTRVRRPPPPPAGGH